MMSMQPLTKSDVQYCDNRDRGKYVGLLRSFNSNTSKHVLKVLHDDGLYRHLHFRPSEGPTFYWFDLVTWPGCLTITGDMGTYTFRRIEDMFDFFTGYINTDYWAEKLQDGQSGGSHKVKDHDAEKFKSWLLHEFWEWSRDQDDAEYVAKAWKRVRDDLLDTYSIYDVENRDQCINALRNQPGRLGDYFQDCWEADWSRYDWSFELCLASIVAGIRTYRAHQEVAS